MEIEKPDFFPDEDPDEARMNGETVVCSAPVAEEGLPDLERGDADEDAPLDQLAAVPKELSILPLRDNVLFPAVVAPLTVTREASVKLIDDAAVAESRIIGIVTLKDAGVETPRFEDLYPVGVAAVIRMMVKMPDGVRLIVHGLQRIRLLEPTQEEPYIRCRIEPMPEETEFSEEEDVEVQALVRNISAGFQRVVQMSANLPDELQAIPMNVREPGTLADLVAAHLPVGTPEKQEILEELDVRERLRKLANLVQRELNVLEVGSRIQSEVTSEMNRMQREYFLREQLKAIHRELGEGDEREAEIEELREKIEASGMPEEARREAERELERLQRMPPAAAEYTVSRTYLDWLTSLPWNVYTEDNLDIPAVREVLDEDHYGLERVKDRLLEYLSVRKFKPEGDVRQPILCFSGPPGVGKTSLGKSIARALGRKFVRFSLGGMRDEAEIRGHRRTYIGALPGQIIQGIRRAGSKNPVMMLDEIDKVGMDFRGDPSSALLEVLDPEQNVDFRDHYLDVSFDLSKVLFITTANVLDTILPPLRDRMEIIELPGYTEEEKVEIAKRHLIPKQLEEHGLPQEMLPWEEAAIRFLTGGYTRESGVRNLEREIAAITRKATREFAEGRTEPIMVTVEQVRKYLGAPRFEFEEVKDRVTHPGVSIGLAWTPFGGDVLFIEAIAMPDGKGGLTLTGQLGDVMKESVQAALSYVRAHSPDLGIPADYFQKHDVHVHVPAGAIPKDGPSAGVTMAAAIASLATGRKARARVAMTGEITLTGRVLPVGGIKEKVLAARRAGIRQVILPERNRKDIDEDVPEQVKESLTFHFVSEIGEVLNLALEETPGAETPGAPADGADDRKGKRTEGTKRRPAKVGAGS
jgi:ATP-dependent Lon protease